MASVVVNVENSRVGLSGPDAMETTMSKLCMSPTRRPPYATRGGGPFLVLATPHGRQLMRNFRMVLSQLRPIPNGEFGARLLYHLFLTTSA